MNKDIMKNDKVFEELKTLLYKACRNDVDTDHPLGINCFGTILEDYLIKPDVEELVLSSQIFILEKLRDDFLLVLKTSSAEAGDENIDNFQVRAGNVLFVMNSTIKRLSEQRERIEPLQSVSPTTNKPTTDIDEVRREFERLYITDSIGLGRTVIIVGLLNPVAVDQIWNFFKPYLKGTK